MEIRQYLLLARKWAWLLILGTVLGAVASYAFSKTQAVIYQTATKIMVSTAQQQDNQYYYAYNDVQLAQSYAQIINNDNVIQSLSDKLGYQVNSNQVAIKSTTDSNFIQLTASDGNPQHASDIANTLVDVFIAYNNSLQDARYKSTEDSLKGQISSVEKQIADLQKQMSQVNENAAKSQQQQIDEQSKQVEKMISDANNEAIQIDTQLETFFPTPQITNTPNPSWIIPTATSVPVPTATLSAADALKYKELQARRDQLSQMRTLLQQAYGNLLVTRQGTTTDPVLQQAQLQNTLALYQQIHSNLLSNYENVELERRRNTATVTQIDKAQVPISPVQPQPMRNALLGAMVGLFLAGGIAFLIEYLDDTLKTPEDIHRYLKVPVIGLIGDMEPHKGKKKKDEAGVFVAENPLSPITEAFRTLRTNLDFANVDKPLKTLVITSTSPSEGKTTVAVNLAAVISQGEQKVVLIDADLRRPAVHRYLNIPNRKGMTDLFRGQSDLASTIVPWGDPPIAVITSGGLPPNPTELLASKEMGRILSELMETSDIIILDTPPAIVTDPILLAAKVDGVIVVIEPGRTRIGPAQVVMEQLERAGARVLGVVLNPISRNRSHYYTKYNYYSYYYHSRGYNSYFGKNGDGKGKSKEKSKEEEQKEA